MQNLHTKTYENVTSFHENINRDTQMFSISRKIRETFNDKIKSEDEQTAKLI
jgi:hypothetical protein